ncbi:unnamed protein product, partial [Effrenium voratum]
KLSLARLPTKERKAMAMQANATSPGSPLDSPCVSRCSSDLSDYPCRQPRARFCAEAGRSLEAAAAAAIALTRAEWQLASCYEMQDVRSWKSRGLRARGIPAVSLPQQCERH